MVCQSTFLAWQKLESTLFPKFSQDCMGVHRGDWHLPLTGNADKEQKFLE